MSIVERNLEQWKRMDGAPFCVECGEPLREGAKVGIHTWCLLAKHYGGA